MEENHYVAELGQVTPGVDLSFKLKSLKFSFSSFRSKYFLNLQISSKVKMGSALNYCFLFLLNYVPGQVPVECHQLCCN